MHFPKIQFLLILSLRTLGHKEGCRFMEILRISEAEPKT